MWIFLVAAYAIAVPSMKIVDTVQGLVHAWERRSTTQVANSARRW